MAYDHDSAEDAVTQPEPFYEMEDEEMTNEFREASIKCIAFMFGAFSFIRQARTLEERDLRTTVVMSAITHPDVAGKADLLLASMHSTTRANFSKHKVTFERQSNLPPTFAQKSIEARGKYRDARNSQLS